MKLLFIPFEYWKILMIGVGFLLVLDSVVLFCMGKINLGTLLPLLIGGGLLSHGLYWDNIGQYLQAHSGLKIVWRLSWLGFWVWLLSFILFAIFLQQAINSGNSSIKKTAFTPKAIITLGSGFKDGKPTPTLAARLDKTAQLANAYPNVLLVMTGGVSMNETLSEAQVMANYLQETYALPAQSMRLETESTSTELNLQNSRSILASEQIGLTEPIAIVTSDFHTLRAKAIAKKQGYTNVQMFGSITPLSIRYHAWLREYFAFVSGWILREY